jgi:hypothetical protein
MGILACTVTSRGAVTWKWSFGRSMLGQQGRCPAKGGRAVAPKVHVVPIEAHMYPRATPRRVDPPKGLERAGVPLSLGEHFKCFTGRPSWSSRGKAHEQQANSVF